MFGRHVERALGLGDVVHAMAQPAVGEAVLAHVEAVALAAQQVLGRDLQVLDLDLGVAAAHDVRQRTFQGHGRDVADDAVAGVGQLDDESRVALVARGVWIGHRHHQGHVGGAGGGGEPLLAVEDVVLVAVLHRGGLHARGVGACGFLCHREADALVAVEQGF